MEISDAKLDGYEFYFVVTTDQGDHKVTLALTGDDSTTIACTLKKLTGELVCAMEFKHASFVLRLTGLACIAFALVTWFMIPASDRSRVKIAPNWRQRDAFESPRHYQLFIAGTIAFMISAVLEIVSMFFD